MPFAANATERLDKANKTCPIRPIPGQTGSGGHSGWRIRLAFRVDSKDYALAEGDSDLSRLVRFYDLTSDYGVMRLNGLR